MEKSDIEKAKQLVKEWKQFCDVLTSPESGWAGYDLISEDFQELKCILEYLQYLEKMPLTT